MSIIRAGKVPLKLDIASVGTFIIVSARKIKSLQRRNKMSDDVLNNYVKSLLAINFENDTFDQNIEVFSKFLGYTNVDYKYNGTYLSQYIAEFKQVCQSLKKKEEQYDKVWVELFKIGQEFEIYLDTSFYVKVDPPDKIERKYISFNKGKIISDTIEVRVVVDHNGNECEFCKEYKRLDDQLSARVYRDVQGFINKK